MQTFFPVLFDISCIYHSYSTVLLKNLVLAFVVDAIQVSKYQTEFSHIIFERSQRHPMQSGIESIKSIAD